MRLLFAPCLGFPGAGAEVDSVGVHGEAVLKANGEKHRSVNARTIRTSPKQQVLCWRGSVGCRSRTLSCDLTR